MQTKGPSLATLAALIFTVLMSGQIQAEDGQPNVIIMMADDMGFSDTSPYGGEIGTPNIQNMADNGIIFTRMYNTARCSTTRASLLSGQYSHNVGMGWLPSTNHNFQNGGTMPGYSGWFAGFDSQSPDNVPLLPEILQDAGYATFMTGKWHLTRSNTINSGPNGTWPFERGFDKFYGTMEGAKDFFEPTYLVDSESAAIFENSNTLPADYFYTNAISNRAAQYIRDEINDGDGQPFFLYNAFYAPHFPLQAPADAEDANGMNLVQKYQAIYASGWEVIRSNRFANQIVMNLFPVEMMLSDRSDSDSGIPDWNTLSTSQRDDLILRMAVYAAQVEIMDQGVGAILDAVRDPNGDGDQSDSVEGNTLIIFLSDNGAVGGDWNGSGSISNWDNSSSVINVRYGTGWANVSDTPFRKFKSDTYEGGIATPFIVSGCIDPLLAGSIDSFSLGHVIDLLPTVLDIADVPYPADADETEVEGESLLPAFDGSGGGTHDRSLFFEHEGNRAVVRGDWKMVAPNGSNFFEVYDLAVDRHESTDLQQLRPDIYQQLRLAWEHWGQRNQVANQLLSNAGAPFLTVEEIDWIGPELAEGDRLVLHLPFDEPSMLDGDVFLDASGNSFEGLFAANDPGNHSVDADTDVPGLGGAIDLNNDYIDLFVRADVPVYSEQRTIAVWFNSDVLGNRRIFGYGDPTGSFQPGSLMLLTMIFSGDQNVIQLRLGSTNLEFAPTAPIELNQWIHTAVVVNENALTTADIDVFINGVKAAGNLSAGDSHVDLITGLSYLTIGRRGGAAPGGSQGSAFDFDGRIGDFQLYSQALSDSQIEYLFSHPGETIADQLLGDLNQDGTVNLLDIAPFVDALTDPVAFQLANPGLDLLAASDFNGDGLLNLLDIQGFVSALSG